MQEDNLALTFEGNTFKYRVIILLGFIRIVISQYRIVFPKNLRILVKESTSIDAIPIRGPRLLALCMPNLPPTVRVTRRFGNLSRDIPPTVRSLWVFSSFPSEDKLRPSGPTVLSV